MKKKILAVILSAAMVLSLAACGKSNTATNDNTDTTDKTVSTESADSGSASSDSANSGKKFKVGMVTDVGGVNDGSFNQTSWEGLQKASKDLGVEVKYLESETDADYAPNIETFVDDDYDLIICVGYMLADAMRASAEANPDQKYAIIDDASCADLPNVTCLMFEQSQASYLAGVVAGMMTKSNKVGFVLGMSNETMNEFGYGYLAGVLDTNPNATVSQYNANSFGDTAVGKSAAVSMITDGVDVIFHAAGGTGLGVIEGCKENGIWAIGVDTDQSSLAPDNILTSAMKRVDTACYDITKDLINGNLTNGIITYDLASNGVDIAPTTDNLTDEVINKVNETKTKIINGEITVPKTKDEFEAKYGDVYELDD
ncbi:MAG: Bmp domain-containing protein [Lachnoclostridium sp.]|jgi:basic membrane protein A and related proteins